MVKRQFLFWRPLEGGVKGLVLCESSRRIVWVETIRCLFSFVGTSFSELYFYPFHIIKCKAITLYVYAMGR